MASANAADVWLNPPATQLSLGSCAGANVFSLPGTDGCLRILGSVATEIGTSASDWHGTFGQPALGSRQPVADLSRPATDGHLAADARVPTDFGPVRIYVSLRNRRLSH